MYKNFSILIFLVKVLENLLQLIAVIALVALMVFVFYMLFALGNSHTMDSLTPFVEPITAIAEIFFRGNNPAFSELQQFTIGILLLSGVFFVSQFLKNRCVDFIKFLEMSKENCRRFEDRQLNKAIHKSAEKMSKKISKCMIYFELRKKERAIESVDMEEQYRLLNQYLCSKLGVVSIKYGEGYLFKFANIETIDSSLIYFFNALKSKAPVDYMIIFQAIETTEPVSYYEIQKLKKAGLYNSIIMSPTTYLRYDYNENKAYTTGIIGNYILENDDISIYELKEKYFDC